MYLSKFQLFNYKSFLDSGLLEFTPGINIIVGQNNSGKTALLEALALNFDNVPHRSIKTLPSSSSRIDDKSRVKISLTFTKDEFILFLDQLPPQSIGIPLPDTHTLTPDIVGKKFKEWLDNPPLTELISSCSGGESLDLNNIQLSGLNNNIRLYHRTEMPTHEKNYQMIYMERAKNGSFKFDKTTKWSSKREYFPITLFKHFKNRIYRFYAERLNLGSCSFGSNSKLASDASNLAEVLNILQGGGKKKVFEHFNQYASAIFPYIKYISVRPEPQQERQFPQIPNSSKLEILVWSMEAAEHDREDLAFPLSTCGTGIGQVLAILYVVLTSQEPRTIIIDEPQSFLHPGAAKKLVEILREFPQHQYFIATHSPMIIAAANPSTIVKLRYEDGETKASVMNSEDVKEQRSLLAELGVSLSDVFGADNIFWVEGETEELCFPLIIEKVLKKPLRGTTILKVRSTGELVEQKNKNLTEIIFSIYHQLSTGKSLVPPAIGFVFDSEGKPKAFQEDIQRKSQNMVEFLKRRMYENYLLHADAITAVINGEYESLKESLTSEEIEAAKVDAARVEKTLEEKKQDNRYLPKNFHPDKLSNSEWVNENIDGAKLLYDLFSELSEARIEFRKTNHSYKLTEWLVEKEPDRLSELAEFLQNVLDRGEEKLRGCL